MLQSKTQKATAIAIFFHTIGLVGILFFNTAFFIQTTPLNLLLTCGLIFYTQEKINKGFLIFFICSFIVGVAVEIIGTSTGALFGQYTYGKMLGPSIKNVPWIIGINWFIIMYCCGVTVHMVLQKLSNKLETLTGSADAVGNPYLKFFSLVSDAAMLAVFFDWILEPAAIKLGYWQWLGDGNIPFYNYACWFVVSALLMVVFNLLKFTKHNIFAVNLLMIMTLFFMLIRTFL